MCRTSMIYKWFSFYAIGTKIIGQTGFFCNFLKRKPFFLLLDMIKAMVKKKETRLSRYDIKDLKCKVFYSFFLQMGNCYWRNFILFFFICNHENYDKAIWLIQHRTTSFFAFSFVFFGFFVGRAFHTHVHADDVWHKCSYFAKIWFCTDDNDKFTEPSW